MLPGKYRIALLLHLAYPVSWAMAGPPAKHKEACNVRTSLHTEDLEQQLRRFFQRSVLVNKLLDKVFLPPPPAPDQATPFLIYEGKKIGSITLHRQGRFGHSSDGWRSMPDKITPLTNARMIWEQVRFAIGDRLVPAQLVRSEESLNKLPFMAQASIEVQERANNNDTVDIHVKTRDQLPLTWTLSPFGRRASLGYNNLSGRGYSLQGQILYRQGWNTASCTRLLI